MSFTSEFNKDSKKEIVKSQIDNLLSQAYQMELQKKVAEATDKQDMVNQLDDGLKEMAAVYEVFKEELSELDK